MDVNAVRDRFPVTRNYNFQNHAAVAPISGPAADAMRSYVDHVAAHGTLKGGFYKHAEHVRKAAAQLINADAGEITFTKNTTEGLGWVAGGLSWNTGDNVVTTSVEFPANMYPWLGLEAKGVQVRTVPEKNGRIPTELLIDAIDTRTRVLTVSAVQYASGYRADLATLGKVCKDKGVLFCVDAIQALGVLPVDVRAMNIDFLSADGHKWLCGPEGCGIFYINRTLIGHLKPVFAGWACMKNAQDYGNYQFEYLDDARKFDTGSYNLAGIYGLGASIEMFLEIGIDNIAAHVFMLTDRLVDGLRDKGYHVRSSREPGEASGIVAFASDVHNHAEIQAHLENEHRIVISLREGRLRASPHLYNTSEEIDQLLHVLPSH